MEKIKKLLWGILFVVLGIIIGLNSLEITDINIFFKGWWTLFIIIPSFIGLFDDDDKTGNLIGLAIGVILFLGVNNVINFELIGKLILPIILVSIGISILFKETIKSNITKKVSMANKEGLESITATFGGQKITKDGEEFKGADLDAVFGGIELDLRNSIIENETVIKASAIFASIEIFVPNDVKIKIKSTPIFGGVSNKSRQNKQSEKTIYIDALCLFGGIEIK